MRNIYQDIMAVTIMVSSIMTLLWHMLLHKYHRYIISCIAYVAQYVVIHNLEV